MFLLLENTSPGHLGRSRACVFFTNTEVHTVTCSLAIYREATIIHGPFAFVGQHKTKGKTLTYNRCQVPCAGRDGLSHRPGGCVPGIQRASQRSDARFLRLHRSPRDHWEPEAQASPLSPSRLFAFPPGLTAFAPQGKDRGRKLPGWGGIGGAPAAFPCSGRGPRGAPSAGQQACCAQRCAGLRAGRARWPLNTLTLKRPDGWTHELSPRQGCVRFSVPLVGNPPLPHARLHEPLSRSGKGRHALWRRADVSPLLFAHVPFRRNRLRRGGPAWRHPKDSVTEGRTYFILLPPQIPIDVKSALNSLYEFA